MLSERDFVKNFEKEMEVYREHSSCINPLAVFESYYFRHGRQDMGYREEALNRCISERVDFSQTENNLGNIMKDFINIKCPECGSNMKYAHNSEYKCRCGNKVSLYLNEFMFSFSKKPWFKVEALNECEGEKEGQVIVPIKAWYQKDDEEGEIVAHIIKHNRQIGGKWLVVAKYLNSRASHDEAAGKVISEVFERLKVEGLESEKED